MHKTLNELRARYPTELRVVFRHYPLSSHARAYTAALASECSGEQGRFLEFTDQVFAKQDSLGRYSWNTLAVLAGVKDTAQFPLTRLTFRGRQVHLLKRRARRTVVHPGEVHRTN